MKTVLILILIAAAAGCAPKIDPITFEGCLDPSAWADYKRYCTDAEGMYDYEACHALPTLTLSCDNPQSVPMDMTVQ